MSHVLIQGPAAQVLRSQIAASSVDMVYADPPFGNRQIWMGKAGSFDDNWSWGAEAQAGWEALVAACPAAREIVTAMAPDRRDRAYLACMAEILLGVRRVLRPTGSLWLHFDDTMGAQLRVLGDLIFGPRGQIGTVIWKRTSSHNTHQRGFGRIHDTIACFGRTPAARWRLARLKSDLVHGDPCEGLWVEGLVEDQLNARSAERVGYPTQKPVSLVSRFIMAATLPGDVVLDPTCGSGTTLVSARALGRSAIGIDTSGDAIAAAEARLDLRVQPTQTDLFGWAA